MGTELNRIQAASVASTRRSRTTLRGGIAFVIALAAVVGGCGGNDDSPPSLGTATPVPTASPTPTQPAGRTPVFQACEGQVLNPQVPVTIPNAANITGESGSVFLDLTPSWGGGDGSDASLLDLGTPGQSQTNRMELIKNGADLRFLLVDSEGVEHTIGYGIQSWQAGEPHSVAVTWGDDGNGQREMRLFVDGHLVGVQPYEDAFNVPADRPLVIGNNAGGGSLLNGFQVYNNPLDPMRIPQLTCRNPG